MSDDMPDWMPKNEWTVLLVGPKNGLCSFKGDTFSSSPSRYERVDVTRSSKLTALRARIAELEKQVSMDTECIERITNKSMSLELELSRERANLQQSHEVSLALAAERDRERELRQAVTVAAEGFLMAWEEDSGVEPSASVTARHADELRAAIQASKDINHAS